MPDISLRHENEKLQKEVLEKLFKTTALTTFEMFRNFLFLRQDIILQGFGAL